MSEPDSRFTYVRFTASGSEYFRIWSVNLLLSVITLGFYLPFAKARRLRYFYANTVVDGHPLAFHGNPWSMFRGYLLMAALFGSHALTSQWWPEASWGFLAMTVLVWPALWRSSLIFRMGNTSWRGLRFGFEGGLARAYAWMPSVVLALGLAALALWLLAKASQSVARAALLPGLWVEDWLPVVPPLCVMALAALALAHGLWILKRYQHGGYRLAQERTQLEGSAKPFMQLGLKLLVWSAAVQVAIVCVAVFLLPRIQAVNLRGHPMLALSGLVMLVLIVLFCSIAVNASSRAWVQHTVWRRTASPHVRFYSTISALDLGSLTIVNVVLVALTLGLYRPFAVIHTIRMRIESMRLEFIGDTDSWHAVASAAQSTAVGEMAGDFFGIDVGL